MKNYFTIIITLLIFVSCTSTEVEVNGNLSGIVKDAKTLKPLVGCIVTKSPGMQSVTTGDTGQFDFGLVEMGEYLLQASLSGYNEQIKNIIVKPSKKVNVELELKEASSPVLRTLPVDAARISTADVRAEIISDGGLGITTCGFYYGKSEKMDMTAFAIQDGMHFSCELTGLVSNTKYYFQSFARNSQGESLGELLTFNTKDRKLPEIVSSVAETVTEETVTLVANTTATGHPDEYAISRCGFFFGEDKNNLNMIDATIENGVVKLFLNGLVPGSKYYFQAYLSNETGEVRSELTSFVSKFYTYEGIEYVDLGLPSGTKWAVRNLGAKSNKELGDIFAWGETSSKADYKLDNYRFWDADSKTYTKYYNADDVLELQDDAAHTILGGKWRLPTKEDFEELKKYTTAVGAGQDDITFSLNGRNLYLILLGHYYRTASVVSFGYREWYGIGIDRFIEPFEGGLIRPVFK